ncbi:hypothetical protein [Nitrosomonas sp. Nm33]|uniref:hypothetical protein n=1 Tax=Nitrosomonas sp. Nm33 TaxID=133724 RepID=UPI000899DFAC|nr:hypothetical protein [Nitrosomonas sp. Nm33]SDY69402.1 hypothetical protein SAMN05421755_10405 [Nitrosomonas sp. Nm33]
MKHEILIPSTVISVLSLSVGLFISSLDRIESTESIRAQDQKQIIGNQLMTQREWGTSQDYERATEAAKKQEQIRMEHRLRMKEHVMKHYPPSDRFRKEKVWM